MQETDYEILSAEDMKPEECDPNDSDKLTRCKKKNWV